MLWWTPFCNKGNGWAKTEMPEQKSEGVKRKKKEKRKKRASEKVTRKLSHGSPCLQQPYFITQRQSLGGNQAYLAILVSPPPPKQLLLPSFLLCFAMGKMNRSTYQLNAYTSDWGGGHVGVHVCLWARACADASVCVSGRRSEGELTTGEQ